jgi:hypothetical protein
MSPRSVRTEAGGVRAVHLADRRTADGRAIVSSWLVEGVWSVRGVASVLLFFSWLFS